VLILDHAHVHEEVAVAAVRSREVHVLLLPPYSLEFNPIEDVFSTGSSWLRRWGSGVGSGGGDRGGGRGGGGGGT